MRILVNAFVYLGEDAGSTHTIEVWRHHLHTLTDSVRLLFPQPDRNAYEQFKKTLDYTHVVFVPGTRRITAFSVLRKFKFIFSSIIYDLFCVWHAVIFKPDIIYIRSRYLSFAPIFYIILRKKFIIEVNGLAQHGATRFSKNRFVTATLRLHIFIERYFFKKACALICVTAKLTEVIKREYNILDNYYVVPNGVNTDHFKPITSSQFKVSSEKIKFGFVGHCAPWQGMGEMIRALAQSWSSNMSLAVVGDGPARAQWEEIASQYLPKGSYNFVGMVSYDDVPRYVASFDVCLAPFTLMRNESIGLSPLKLFEYLASGKPVLTTCISGVGELVKKYDTGVVAGDDSVNALKNALLQMINRRNEWNAMGQRGRHLVERQYSWKKAAEKTIQILYKYQ
ncbi:MAG: glycosyltransferase family 4 protein [Candidatus Kerfeldbacteria bacterium]|nr:glycosyltransferase family 4 protein [Candidatus Kerfeldbacteria bacterium]